LEWSAIFGGAVLSAAITTVMAAFGSAIGLSLVSADTARSTGMTALTIAAGLWAIWITVSACWAGGYLAGRMRRPAADASDHERRVRDGAHGLVVWAAGALIVTALASSSLFGAAKTAATGVAAASSGAAALIAQQADPLGTALDSVMRTNGAAPPSAEERQEASRIFMSGLSSGKLEAADRDYIASRVAARMNIPQPEAQSRVDDAFTKLNQAKETAKQAAERARKIAVITAFLTAAVLLLGAAAAWMAAQLGGKHRDEAVNLSAVFGKR
jgi:heme/copper-type cytochrome/quinol oxidase subunit 2